MTHKLVRFDWAIKKLLRDKANFDILEGFLTVVLSEPVVIEQILESESNQEAGGDKFNKVDLLVRNSRDELIIIEVQNNKEYDYFQRMLYGTAKVITEYVELGQAYAQVKKVYSITVAYFDLGQGDDYVYHGKTEFRGIHNKEQLQLAAKQVELFNKNQVHEIYPEYWIIKADKFNDQVGDNLDEWVYFLKHSKIPEEFDAPGLSAAREKLHELRLSDAERQQYLAFQKRLHDLASERFTQEVDFADLLKKREQQGIKQGIEQVAISGIKTGLDNPTIMQLTGLTEKRVNALRTGLEKS